VLQAAAERNGGVAEDDIDEEIGGARAQNNERVTREAFIRRSRCLDEENEV